MKKSVFLMLGVAAMLASCSQDELGSPQGEGVAVITATVGGGMQTRVPTYDNDDVAVDRCLLEVYDQSGNLVGRQHEATAAGADGAFTFTVSGLDPDAAYDFVFWADNKEANAYDGDLKNRKLQSGADLTEAIAFHGMLDGVTPANADKVTLTHAVAKVTLKTTSTLNAGDKVSLGMTDVADTWNVQAGTASGNASLTYGYTLTQAVTGQADGAEVTTFYVPAPAEGANSNMTLEYTPNGSGTPGEAAINNVPLKADYRTVLRGDIASLTSGGAISITATMEKAWNDQDGEIEFPVSNVIETTAAGQLTSDAVVKAAEAGNGSVVIKGAINVNDLEAIADCKDLRINLDLSEATLYSNEGTLLTEFPNTLLESKRRNPRSEAILTGIILPDGIESLAGYSFIGCESLASVTLPEGLKTIGVSAFQQTALTSITFPKSLETINGYAFSESKLEGELIVPESVTVSSTSTFSKTNITSAVWNTSSDMKNNTFSGCMSLQTVTVNNCGSIDYNAFGMDCTVSTLVINMTTPPAIARQSEFTAEGIEHIYVPAEAVDAYKAAEGWSNYADIIESVENMPVQ